MKMKELLPGTIAKIEGPFGVFDYKSAKNKSQIWIAGGIGIAPFISMARSLSAKDGYKIDLYYCVKNEIEAVYLGLLQNISMSLSNDLRIFTVYSDEGNRIDAEFVQKTSGKLSSKTDIFLCAPPAMIHALKEQFIFKGVSKNLMHSEEFNF
jgi:predicted ferric reductase